MICAKSTLPGRLDTSVILSLVHRFMALTTDEKRQAVIDSLGLHPVNHACFAYHLGQLGHAHDWQVYRGLTGSM